MLPTWFSRVRAPRRILWILSCSLSRRDCNSATSAALRVDKNPSLADEPVSIWIEGLKPRQKVTLHASTRLPNEAIFEGFSHYVASEAGVIALDHDESHGGSFTGVCPMGPLSFMTGSLMNKRKFERFMIKDPTKPFTVDFRVLDSFTGDLDSSALQWIHQTPPNSTITRVYMTPGVREYNVWEGKVRGTLYLPPGDGPFPGVISMSGGYPGAMKYKAALLASHGFAAIALKYFGEDDLPEQFFYVNLDYMEEAATYLKNHSKVDGKEGVGIIANCYGATIGLALASLGPTGLIRSVISVSGWSFNYGYFSYKGEHVKMKTQPKREVKKQNGITEWKYSFLNMHDKDPAHMADEMCFPIHKCHETAVMFVAGGKDGYLANGGQEIAEFHRSVFRSSAHPNHEVLLYPYAGHLIEHSFYPFCDTVWTMGEPHFVGGEQPYHSEAQIDSWPKILEFARKTLRS